MELEALQDEYLVAIAFCGLFFTTLITIYIFSISHVPENVVDNEEDNLPVGEAGAALLRKERDPVRRKENIRLSRLKAKSDIQKYKESCQKSQLQNRRNETVAGTSLVSLDNVLDFLSEQPKVFNIENCAKSLKLTPANLTSILSDLVTKHVMCGIIYNNSEAESLPRDGGEVFIQFSEEELDHLMSVVGGDSPVSVATFQEHVRDILEGCGDW